MSLSQSLDSSAEHFARWNQIHCECSINCYSIRYVDDELFMNYLLLFTPPDSRQNINFTRERFYAGSIMVTVNYCHKHYSKISCHKKDEIECYLELKGFNAT